MKASLYILVILFMYTLPNTMKSQMILVTKDRKVSAIDNLKEYEEYYQYVLLDSQVTMYTPKNEISYIEPYTGNIEDYRSPRLFESQRTMAIKISLTGLGDESVISCVEKSINGRVALEAGVKIHTKILKDYHYEDISGWGIEAGLKYRIMGPYHLNGQNKIKHLMSGGYVKPAIGYSHRKETSYEGIGKYNIVYGGMNLGYQFIIVNGLVIDLYAGAYMYSGRGSLTPSHELFSIPAKVAPNEGDMKGKNNFSRSIGIKVGVLIGSKK